MAPVSPEPPDLLARLVSTIEVLAKIGGGLSLVWVFLAKIAKPWLEWRRESITRTVRDALSPELRSLTELIEREEGCAERNEALHRRQERIFDEFDTMLEIMIDNRERLDEQNDLLDQVFALDRRVDGERRVQIDKMLADLNQRRKEARRDEDK